MFRDLCSCHKSKKKQQDADDDLPYSPNKSKSFFVSERKKKSYVICERMTSTPNQLNNVRKLNEDQNMDVQNNNQFSDSNNSLLSSNLTPDLINSPIEKDSKVGINLDSNDELNQLSVNHELSRQNRSSFQMNEQNNLKSSNDLKESNNLNECSNLWSKPDDLWTESDNPWSKTESNSWIKPINHQNLNDNYTKENVIDSNRESAAFRKLPKNSSTSDLLRSSLSPSSIELSMRNKSSTNLELNDKSNPVRSNERRSFFDSTDNMMIDQSKNHLSDNQINNLLDKFKNLNEDQIRIKNHPEIDKNEFSNREVSNQFDKRKDEFNKNPPDDHLNSTNHDLNPITNLINLPLANTGTLKRVSSDDKISLDNLSIESVVLDKHSNELVKKARNQPIEDDNQSAIKHANSILIQEYLTLTLRRDKNDKKSLNEFSIDNPPKSFFETMALAKEYFYDKPVIKTTSRFIEPDLSTYRMQSDPRGYCLIINNATTSQCCLRLKNGFNKEVIYLKDVFTKLGFTVEINYNLKALDILNLMKKVKKKNDFTEHDAFICIFFGHGNQNYLIGEDNFKVNLELVIGYMNNYHCPKLLKKPKIFIVHTCNSTCQTFLEPIPPSNIPREIQALKKISDFKIIPTWTDTVIIYSPFVNSNLYYSPFVKEFGSLLCSNAFELSLHDILLQTNERICKKSHYEGQYGVDFNYRGFNKALYFNPGHFIVPN